MVRSFRHLAFVLVVLALLLTPASNLRADEANPLRLPNLADRVIAWLTDGIGEIAVVFAGDALYPEMDPNGLTTSSTPAAPLPDGSGGEGAGELPEEAPPED